MKAVFHVLWMSVLGLAPILCAAEPAADAVKEFKSWFKDYRNGKINLYQKSAVPIANDHNGGYRYFRKDNVEEMDRLLAALALRNDLDAAMALTDAATFAFDRRGDVEVSKYYEKQPWTMRSHAADALAKITDEKALGWITEHLLESRSQWDSRYRRCLGARVLAEATDQAKRFLSALDDKDEKVREAALRALGLRGTVHEIEQIYERLADGSQIVRVAAVEAVGKILANDRNTHPTLFYECMEKIKPLLDDPSWTVIDSVLSFMETFRDLRSIPVLVDYLGKVAAGRDDYRERTFRRIIEVLHSLTGVTSPGSDPQAWKEWWNENEATFVLPPEVPMRIGYQTGAAHFFSIPINSDNALFILDISGSMAAPLDQTDPDSEEESKLERACGELMNALSDLDPSVHFNIFLFNDSIKRFSKDFKSASKVNIIAAEHFFRRAQAEGGTNIFDALNQALKLEEIGIVDRFGDDVECDTVFLLSDGVPSSGMVIDPEEIINIISSANQRNRIRFHTIYLGEEHSDFMRKFAQKNFGEYIRVR